MQKPPSVPLAIGGQTGTMVYMVPEVVAAKFCRQGHGNGEGGRILLRYTHVGAARRGEALPGSEQGGDREQRLFARC